MNLISIKNLNFSYEKDKQILNKVNLNINSNELIALVGVNGSGKSTLIKLILGLLSNDNISKNLDVNKIGYLEQGDTLFPNLTVLDNIKLIKSFYNSDKNMNGLITKLNVDELLKSKIKDLSGGQKKRVQLLISMVNDPEMLILDEPTSEVDMKNAQEFWKFFKELKNEGMSILVITHDLLAVKEYCDRCIFINEGKIVDDINDMKKTISVFNKVTGANYAD